MQEKKEYRWCQRLHVRTRMKRTKFAITTKITNVREEVKLGMRSKMKAIASLVTNLLHSGTMCIN